MESDNSCTVIVAMCISALSTPATQVVQLKYFTIPTSSRYLTRTIASFNSYGLGQLQHEFEARPLQNGILLERHQLGHSRVQFDDTPFGATLAWSLLFPSSDSNTHRGGIGICKYLYLGETAFARHDAHIEASWGFDQCVFCSETYNPSETHFEFLVVQHS